MVSKDADHPLNVILEDGLMNFCGRTFPISDATAQSLANCRLRLDHSRTHGWSRAPRREKESSASNITLACPGRPIYLRTWWTGLVFQLRVDETLHPEKGLVRWMSDTVTISKWPAKFLDRSRGVVARCSSE